MLFGPDPLPPRVRPKLWAYPAIRWHPDPRNHENARLHAHVLMLQLRFLRVEQGLTREELSELTSIPVSAIKRAERYGEITLERFAQLVLQLGFDTELRGLFARRRYKVPYIVLIGRGKNAKHGRRDRRRRMARIAAETVARPRGPA